MVDPSTVAAIAWKTSLLLVVIGLIVSLTARQSAAWRHFLWTCALALALLMPIAVELLPSYVQVTVPWEAAEPSASDAPAPVPAGARKADAAPEVRGPSPIASQIRCRSSRVANSISTLPLRFPS